MSWTFAGPSGNADRLAALAVDPRSDSVIYAATPGGGVWKTLDAGLSWAPIFDSQASLQTCSIALDPHAPDVIYVGTGDSQHPRDGQGVARSSDGGLSWASYPRISTRPICALAIDPTDTSHIFAGSDEGLFVSSDAALTWTKALSVPITSIALGSPGNVYVGMLGDVQAGTRQHILSRSSDGGRTWTDLPLPQNLSVPQAPTTGVTVTTSDNSVFVAVAYASSPFSQVDFYNATDSTLQWNSAFNIGQAHLPMAVLLDQNKTLYLTGTNLIASADGGFSWSVIPTKNREFHTGIWTGGTLLLGGESGFEFTGSNRGITPIPTVEILGTTIDRSGRIWAGGPAGLFGLFPSSNFSRVGVPGVGAVGSVGTVTGGNSTTVYASGARVAASTDGVQFSSQQVIPVTELRATYPPMVVDPNLPSSAFVGGQRIYHTTDSGSTWTALGTVDPDATRVVIALAMAPAARTVLFAATACIPNATSSCPSISTIWRSTNAGQTWTQMSIVGGFVNQIAIDPRQTARVYAAIGAFPAGPSAGAGLVSGDLLLSTNSGGVWTSLLGNMPRTSINTVIVDPTSLTTLFTDPAQRIYVGTETGVFASFDAGTRWLDISAGLPATPVTDLALLQPDGVLVAGTFGRGVFQTSVTGLAAGLIVQPLSRDLIITRDGTKTIGFNLSNISSTTTISWSLKAIDPLFTFPQASGDLRPLASIQIPVTVSATNLQPGLYIGRIQLTSAFGTQNITVSALVAPTPAQLVIKDGNDAKGLPGDSLPPLQVAVFDAAGNPLSGVPVMFTIAAGSGTLNDREIATNASGIASVVLTLPSNPGTVQVVATADTLSVTFTETALAAPIFTTDSVFDAVTFNANTSFGPGSILTILGQNLATTTALASGALPTSLASTQVLLTTPAGEVALPLFAVSPTQITALLPLDSTPGRYHLHVAVDSIRSDDIEIAIAAFDPGIFTANGSGRGPGIFIKDNGSFVSASNPADRGSRVSFYAAGLGVVSPSILAGGVAAASEPLNRTVQLPRVFFDRFSATVLYSGLAPGQAGRYLVTVQVPASVSPATNVSLSLTMGGFTSNRVTIPVR